MIFSKKIKIIIMLLVFSLLFGFTGCKNNSNSNKVDSNDGYVIGFSNFSVGNSWRIQMEAEFKAKAEDYKSQGIIKEYYMANAKDDISKQIADIHDFIAKKCDAIVITAKDPDKLSPVCEEAKAAGIVVISFDNYVTTNNITAKVGIDEVEFGKTGAQWLVDKLNRKGKIIVLNGIEGTGVDKMRYEGAMNVFAKYPDIKILGEAHADWDYNKAKTVVEGFLSKYKKIDGVWSQGGAMTQAALDVFTAKNRPLVPMSGEANNGLLKAWKKNLKNGFDSIAPCSPTSMSADALDTAVNALDGKEVKLNTIISLPVITRDTLDDYVRMKLPDDFWNYTILTSKQIDELYK